MLLDIHNTNMSNTEFDSRNNCAATGYEKLAPALSNY